MYFANILEGKSVCIRVIREIRVLSSFFDCSVILCVMVAWGYVVAPGTM
jgi:hypothetical protein